jgi:hypothetical protein
MLIKILIIGGGLYYLYTRFIGHFQIPGAKQDPEITDQSDNDDEYVDYEEVD